MNKTVSYTDDEDLKKAKFDKVAVKGKESTTWQTLHPKSSNEVLRTRKRLLTKLARQSCLLTLLHRTSRQSTFVF